MAVTRTQDAEQALRARARLQLGTLMGAAAAGSAQAEELTKLSNLVLQERSKAGAGQR